MFDDDTLLEALQRVLGTEEEYTPELVLAYADDDADVERLFQFVEDLTRESIAGEMDRALAARAVASEFLTIGILGGIELERGR